MATCGAAVWGNLKGNSVVARNMATTGRRIIDNFVKVVRNRKNLQENQARKNDPSTENWRARGGL